MKREFFDKIDQIDHYVQLGPDEVDFVRDLAPLIEEPSVARYFFAQIDDSQWLDVFRDEGVLTAVPEMRTLPDGTIAAPSWDVSDFIKRVSRAEPERALLTLKRIPETNNPRVHHDLIQILLNAPPPLTADWSEPVRRWISNEYRLYFAEDVAELATRWGEANLVTESLNVFRTLLAIRAPSDEKASEETLISRIETRIDSWRYDSILEEYVIERLAPVVGKPTVILLTDLLADAVSITADNIERHEDHSYIWHPVIGKSRERGDTVRSALVTALRRSLEILVEDEPASVPGLVNELEDQKWTVFRRIALYLLSYAPEAAEAAIVERLTDPELFHEVSVRKEYVDLLKQQFHRLSNSAQETVLDRIANGPDLEAYRVFRKNTSGHEVSDEELKEYAETWRRDRLGFLRKDLPTKWKERLEELEGRYGPAADVAQPFRSSGVWVGPTSPRSEPELKQLSAVELVAFLRDWTPSEDRTGSTREGLARILTAVVAERSEELTSQAKEFKTVAPIYLGGFFRGVEKAMTDEQERKEPRVHWDDVLALAKWVSEASEADSGRNAIVDQMDGQELKEARRAVLSVLKAGLSSEYDLSFTYADVVWQILKDLTRDPEPTRDHEEHYISEPRDAYMVALNTVRGSAVDALIRFGLWLHRTRESSEESDTNDMDRMKGLQAELFNLLDLHLDSHLELSRAVHSVYGRWYPWLLLMDEEWASTRVDRVFPPSRTPMWEAAWSAYILFCPPYDAAFDVLAAQYWRAVDHLVKRPDDSSEEEENRHLAFHLMTYYWRGKLDADPIDDLLLEFFRNAAGDLRRHAIEFIGRSLKNTSEPIEATIINRLKSLYEWRLSEVRKHGIQAGDDKELGAFVTWFSAERLDDHWVLMRLIESLELGGKLHWGTRMVIERLSDLASEMPHLTALTVIGIVENAAEMWEIGASKDELRQILETIRATGDSKAIEIAAEAADKLGRKGFYEFRDLSEV